MLWSNSAGSTRDRHSPPPRGFFFPLEAMEVTGKSKTGEAGRKALIARADARASQLAPIVAELRRGGITSWYGIAMELNRRGVPDRDRPRDMGTGAGPPRDGTAQVGRPVPRRGKSERRAPTQ